MIRGTTPTITLKAKFDLRDWYIYATIENGLTEMTFEGTQVSVRYENGYSFVSFSLTQEQTLKFPANTKCEIQLRAIKDETAVASKVVSVDVERILKDGVILG